MEREPGASISEPLTHRSLIPLAKLRSLKTFTLQCDEALSLTNNELCALLSQNPSLEHVLLNHEPLFLSPTELTIDVLPMLAESCPQLVELYLYLNTDVEGPGSVPLFTFKHMERVSFGVSPVHDKHLITKLLARVLPETCEVRSNPLYLPNVEALFTTGPEDQYVRGVRRGEWAQISEWIPVLLDFHREASSNAMITTVTGLAVGQN